MKHDEDCEGHTHLNTKVASVDFTVDKPLRIFIQTTDHNAQEEAMKQLEKLEPKIFQLLKDKASVILGKIKPSIGTETIILVCTQSHDRYRIYMGTQLKKNEGETENQIRIMMEGEGTDPEEGLVNMQINEIRMSADPDWHGIRREPQTFEGETVLTEARKNPFFNEVFADPKPVLSPMSEAVIKAKLSPEKRAELVKKYGEEAIKTLEDRQKGV